LATFANKEKSTLTTLHLGPFHTTIVTELPTTKGPSSVEKGTHGHERRSWTVKDPGGRLENIAIQRRRLRQRRRSGDDM
jgi:hypothetical protein